jgi:SAM-dependent methyltransferase
MTPAEIARYWEANAETWTRLARAGYDVYRDELNTPAFLALLPPVQDLAGLDVGCGEGSNTRLLARRGAQMQGVDIAPTFIRHAQAQEALEPLNIRFRTADAMALPYPDASFDFVTAFMSLMDIADPALALREAARVIRRGGFVQFSILHPCFVPHCRKVVRDQTGKAIALEVGGYFATETRLDVWHFPTLERQERDKLPPFRIPRRHYTLSEWIGFVCGAGLRVDAMVEPAANEEQAAADPVIADTQIAPLFLQVRASRSP